MKWTIPIPVWGPDTYFRKFELATLPAIRAALGDREARFVVHTDRPDAIKRMQFQGPIDIREIKLSGTRIYDTYGEANREVLNAADDNECFALLASDIIVSKEFFDNAEKQFADGARAVVGSAARTLAAPEDCPVGAKGRELLEWGFTPRRRHPVTEGCFWGRGRNVTSWLTYWEGPHGIVARAFHLHPFAVMADRVLYFERNTVDLDLLDRFELDEIHVITDPDECSFAEISGLEKQDVAQLAHPVGIPNIVWWAKQNTTPMQRWLFTHRIIVQGTGEDHLDEAPCEIILKHLG